MAINIRKGKALEALNLTPLIDVVFLLLIFFLVATRFAPRRSRVASEAAFRVQRVAYDDGTKRNCDQCRCGWGLCCPRDTHDTRGIGRGC